MSFVQPIRITVTTPDGKSWIVPQFQDFQLTLSMREFSDSFDLTLGDPEGSLISKVYNDSTVTVDFGDQTVIVGQINSMSRGERDWGNTIHVSGRSKASEWAESDAVPKKYKKTTDNEVIKDVFAGSGFLFDLDAAVTHSEWDVGVGTRKAEAANAIAEAGGFYLWHSGQTIFKKKVATSGGAVKTYIGGDSKENGIPALKDSIDLSIDTSKCRSKLIFFGSDSKHDKIKETRNITLTLKLQTPERKLTLNRIQRISIDEKDKAAATRSADDNVFRAQPSEKLSLEVRGRDTLPLNSVAKVVLPQHAVNTTLVCYEKQFQVGGDGRSTTQLSFVPLGRPLP